jgi:hypothetical protein
MFGSGTSRIEVHSYSNVIMLGGGSRRRSGNQFCSDFFAIGTILSYPLTVLKIRIAAVLVLGETNISSCIIMWTDHSGHII